jgi:hypothetical protein
MTCTCHDLEDTRIMCPTHWCALHLSSFLHWPGHEDCCDRPMVRKLADDFGWESVVEAVELLPASRAEYARLVVEGMDRDPS